VFRFEDLFYAVDFERVPYSNLDTIAVYWAGTLDKQKSTIQWFQLREQGIDVKLIPSRMLLVAAISLDATRPEDKVHGMYGCAKRLGLNWPTPDYTKPVAEVYTEATLACLRHDNSLAAMAMAIGPAVGDLGLPSWVPDMSRRPVAFSLSQPPRVHNETHMRMQYSGEIQCEWNLLPDRRRLQVRGRRFDSIAAVSKPLRAQDQMDLPEGTDSINARRAEWWESREIFLDCFGTWFELALQRCKIRNSYTNASNGLVAISSLAYLLTSGRNLDIEPPPQFLETLHLFIMIGDARRDDPAMQTFSTDHENDIDEPEVNERMLNAMRYMSPFVWKLIFLTENQSRLGIGNYNAKADDIVVILGGMDTPCLLRPCTGGFNFIGAAFVDEITNDAFWEGGPSKDDEWFTLI
jgi:hypothetical protein